MKLDVRTFVLDCTEKEQAAKVLEEAAEVFGAWQTYQPYNKDPTCSADLDGQSAFFWVKRKKIRHKMLADEIADVIQAACNLAARYDIDVAAAMERCEQRNRARGRYDSRG